MDNRVPKPVRDYLDKEQAKAKRADADAFLSFLSWLSQRGNLKTEGWITVAESALEEHEHRLTTSYLIPVEQVPSDLADERFDGFDLNDGVASTIGGYLGRGPDLHAHDSPLRLDAKPFVLHRYFHGCVPARFELVQAFEVYWNAWWDDNVLRRIDLDGQVHDVARRSVAEKHSTLEIDADHLKAFLAEAGCALTRLHSHRRFSDNTITTMIDEISRDDTGVFEIQTRNVRDIREYAAQGDLRGRDFVMPYKGKIGGGRAGADMYETFAVGRDTDGELREISCDPSTASSYFRDTGSDHYLTPVFFRAGVLRRYYDDPRRFNVQQGHLQCLDLWAIDYERNKDDLIQVYLGDLGRLPYAEQRHWRTYNEVVDSGISEERFARDFVVQWTAPAPEPAFDLLRAIESVNATVEVALGRALFRPLSPSDEHIRTGLRVPLEDSAEEADSQLTAAAKLIIETIDNDLLRANVPQGTDVKALKGLNLLEALLSGLASSDEAASAMTPLYNIYYLRSTGSAHYRGSAWEETLRRSGLAGLGYRDMVREAFRQAAHSLSDIQVILSARVNNQQSG